VRRSLLGSRLFQDNPKHAAEEVTLSEIEIVGKALYCLKFAWSPISVKNREKLRAVVSAFRSRRIRRGGFRSQ
jgi:hypothetical protein